MVDKLAKDLAEDKEYLKRQLERHAPKGDLLRWKENWWASDDTVLTVARILDDYGIFNEFDSPTRAVIDFFEAPYKFEEKMRFIVENM